MRLHVLRPRLSAFPGGKVGLGAAVLLGAITACSPLDPGHVAGHLHLTHLRPTNPEGLFLNEELVFYFDEELDPASVTRASIEILAQDGRPARGELRVETDRVRFVPAAVLSADLTDGGYQPDTRYTATIAGFPRPTALRSARGAVLEKTWTWQFHTVQVSRPRTGLVFEDRMQERVGILRLFPSAAGQGGLIRAQDSIYLACDKPIDPSTVVADAFLLTFLPTDPQRTRTSPPKPVGVRVRVVEDEPEVARRPRPADASSSATAEAWERERRACVIELNPDRRFGAGTWELKLRPESPETGPWLRDFGGRPVLLAEPSASFRISVDDPSADARRGELSEEFDGRLLFSPVAVPGYDGTAYWKDSGRVEVRYPAAAGNGEAGVVVLGAREDRADVQATSIELPKDSECRLSSKPGLVVLRCQGRMSIGGKLVREAPWDAHTKDDATLNRWEELCASRRTSSQSLSDWLAEVRAADANWTVLIAGGDLAIDDSLTTTTPLLLVAGGRVRVSGLVHGASHFVEGGTGTVGCVYLLREGGGFGIVPTRPHVAPILVDEPQGPNPLRVPLRFAALSGPIPQRGEIVRWLTQESGGSSDRVGEAAVEGGSPEPPIGGTWRVRYLRDFAAVPNSSSALELVDNPGLFDPAGPVRFLVELELTVDDQARIWNPPWVDFVRLTWEQPPVSSGAAGGDR
ncbi:MAG TPA: Ig-like domain-containing protein [Planctomycetota bacterium]|nr:Ig-like domain-containing protein [Planctomycetota bacterium]